MAAVSGRTLTFDWNSTTLASVKKKGYTLNNELVDVTTDDADGWRTFLDVPGMSSVDLTIEGVTDDQVLLADGFNNISRTATINLPTTTGTISGTFLIESFEENGEHNGAVLFTCSLKSSGTVTFTAGS